MARTPMIVYAKYIQLNITFDPVHRYSYESPCEQGGTGRIWVRSEIRPVSCERSIAICLDDFAFDSQNREKNQSWMVKVNLILHIMIKWASGYGLTRVFNF